MNILYNSKYRFVIILLSGLFLLYSYILTFQSLYIKDIDVLVIAIALGVTFFVICVIKDIKEYKLTRKAPSLSSTFLGVLLIITFSILYFNHNQKLKSASLVIATSQDLLGKYEIDFKNNGDYIITKSDYTKGINYLYGRYTINDSIITLDKPNIDDVIKTKRLIIKSMLDESHGDCKKIEYISLVDSLGIESDTDLFLQVNDKRNK